MIVHQMDAVPYKLPFSGFVDGKKHLAGFIHVAYKVCHVKIQVMANCAFIWFGLPSQ